MDNRKEEKNGSAKKDWGKKRYLLLTFEQAEL
jgi:hypothetical protein